MNVGRRAPKREEGTDPCIVPNCGAPAVRSLAMPEAKRAFEHLPDSGRRAPLCRAHYKEWKKLTRGERQLERLGW